MSRRASLPGAAELFRSTGGPAAPAPTGRATAPPPMTAPVATPPAPPSGPEESQLTGPELPPSAPAAPVAPPAEAAATRTSGVRSTGRRRSQVGERRPTGRERHEEKITVYVSPDELIDLEQARLT